MDYLSKFEELKSENLSLDLTRGKPSSDQLDLSNSLMNLTDEVSEFEGLDLRNYGQIKGLESCSCLLYTSPSPRDKRQSRMPSSA